MIRIGEDEELSVFVLDSPERVLPLKDVSYDGRLGMVSKLRAYVWRLRGWLR